MIICPKRSHEVVTGPILPEKNSIQNVQEKLEGLFLSKFWRKDVEKQEKKARRIAKQKQKIALIRLGMEINLKLRLFSRRAEKKLN